MIEECTTDIGALRFPLTSGPVPSKSNTADPFDSSIETFRDICEIRLIERRD